MKEYVLKYETGHINTAPMGFHLYAQKFLEAAPPSSARYSPVPFYCVCRAIELALKSFLSARGIPVKKLKTLGHDLQALLQTASAQGIADHCSFSDVEKAELLKANTYYSDKGFEYFQLRFAMRDVPPLPNLDTLKSMTQSLLGSIHQLALDAT